MFSKLKQLAYHLKHKDIFGQDQFTNIAKDRLGNNPLAQYIAEEVWNSSKSPNIRDCVRIAAVAKCEQDVLRYLRVLGAVND